MSASPTLRSVSGAARTKDVAFRIAMLLCLTASVLVLGLLMFDVLRDGLPKLNSALVQNFPSSRAERAGLQPALFGTIWVIAV
ncbi:MAG: phosphate transport system permease protein, partial [Solirubrobacteraceae bacterium]|nr:phosphate transport system permease protein [Solirubrobacteraceae bacterium]